MISEATKARAAVQPEDIAMVFTSAEREIAALYTAVYVTYGPEHAELAALDWLREMEGADWSVGDRFPNWRSFTYVAAAKLAERLCLVCPSIRLSS